MEAINLADLYQLPLLDWASIEDKLRSGVTQAPGTGGPKRHTCWLSTINADGSPHVNGVGALWADGCFWFETGQASRKGRNLARDPRCSMSLATGLAWGPVAAGRRIVPNWRPGLPGLTSHGVVWRATATM
jgi:Pyridoxamine 5'-phosphate oxidase